MADRWTYDVFVSYATVDARWAERIAQDLPRSADTELRVFLDRAQISAVTSWSAELEETFLRTRHLLVVWTPDAARSPVVAHAVERFYELQRDDPDERRIVPIWLGGPAFEARGSQIQPVVDLRE